MATDENAFFTRGMAAAWREGGMFCRACRKVIPADSPCVAFRCGEVFHPECGLRLHEGCMCSKTMTTRLWIKSPADAPVVMTPDDYFREVDAIIRAKVVASERLAAEAETLVRASGLNVEGYVDFWDQWRHAWRCSPLFAKELRDMAASYFWMCCGAEGTLVTIAMMLEPDQSSVVDVAAAYALFMVVMMITFWHAGVLGSRWEVCAFFLACRFALMFPVMTLARRRAVVESRVHVLVFGGLNMYGTCILFGLMMTTIYQHFAAARRAALDASVQSEKKKE